MLEIHCTNVVSHRSSEKVSNIVQRRHGRITFLKGTLMGTSGIYLVGDIIINITTEVPSVITRNRPYDLAVPLLRVFQKKAETTTKKPQILKNACKATTYWRKINNILDMKVKKLMQPLWKTACSSFLNN